MVQSELRCQHIYGHPLTFPQIWEYFLASSTITSRQGGATCYQITLVKNINSTHRITGVPTQFNLSGALASGKPKQKQNWLGTAGAKLGKILA